ncbi:TonB family protein [Billgrantia endophytica]|uniref:TonB C-terminal domain-containing protein n=1 Tax=Billgrantia endophytica TaxID=2033802 RepID=A0A2N7U2J7_9GAMM|nr:TonB family protein [Halomonas endophytica]PMR74661.1 hypothetical protein C1H69_12425 [Halomonas endophytica]
MAVSSSAPIRYAPVTQPHRRWLAVAAAILLHLALFGIVSSWQFASAPAERSSLDVVLVTRPADIPVEADAIAEASQLASGEPAGEASAESRAAPLDELPVLDATESLVDPVPPAEPDSTARPEPESAITEDVPAVDETASERQATPEPRDGAPQAAESPAAPSAAVPSASGRDLLAQATSSIREQGMAPGAEGPGDGEPRPAAQRAAEARYIDDWTRRVEDYGNRVHPAPSHLHGRLRIRVVIGRDGQLLRAEVIQSSGHTELDQAALDTVHGAGPYRPFDRGMGELDSLSITRVWRFGQGNHFGVR